MAKKTKLGVESLIGKRVAFDHVTWLALDLYGRDSMKTFQELADEAFADLLAKHNRPVDLKDALRRSARAAGANDKRGTSKPASGRRKTPRR